MRPRNNQRGKVSSNDILNPLSELPYDEMVKQAVFRSWDNYVEYLDDYVIAENELSTALGNVVIAEQDLERARYVKTGEFLLPGIEVVVSVLLAYFSSKLPMNPNMIDYLPLLYNIDEEALASIALDLVDASESTSTAKSNLNKAEIVLLEKQREFYIVENRTQYLLDYHNELYNQYFIYLD